MSPVIVRPVVVSGSNCGRPPLPTTSRAKSPRGLHTHTARAHQQTVARSPRRLSGQHQRCPRPLSGRVTPSPESRKRGAFTPTPEDRKQAAQTWPQAGVSVAAFRQEPPKSCAPQGGTNIVAPVQELLKVASPMTTILRPPRMVEASKVVVCSIPPAYQQDHPIKHLDVTHINTCREVLGGGVAGSLSKKELPAPKAHRREATTVVCQGSQAECLRTSHSERYVRRHTTAGLTANFSYQPDLRVRVQEDSLVKIHRRSDVGLVNRTQSFTPISQDAKYTRSFTPSLQEADARSKSPLHCRTEVYRESRLRTEVCRESRLSTEVYRESRLSGVCHVDSPLKPDKILRQPSPLHTSSCKEAESPMSEANPSGGVGTFSLQDIAQMPIKFHDRNGCKPYRILCYGDSLTAGFCNNGKKYEPYGYTLAKKLSASGCPSDVYVCGLSGLTAKELLAGASKAVLVDIAGARGRGLANILQQSDPFDLVIIMSGTNDLGYNRPASDIFEDICALHSYCHQRGAQTVAMAVPTSTKATGRWESSRQLLNQRLEKWSQQFPGSVSFAHAGEMVPVMKERHLVERDGLHFSPEGSRQLGTLLEPLVAGLLSGSNPDLNTAAAAA